jgi:hypothetical protein
MSQMSRRDLLRAGAATAAVVVPVVTLAGSGTGLAAPPALADVADVDDVESFERALAALQAEGVSVDEPMMLLVDDARLGRVSILHGTSETVVEDRALVGKIVRAKSRSKA